MHESVASVVSGAHCVPLVHCPDSEVMCYAPYCYQFTPLATFCDQNVCFKRQHVAVDAKYIAKQICTEQQSLPLHATPEVSVHMQVDCVIGADGANSRVAKEIGAGEYDYAIAFQERIRIPDDKMDYYKDLAEMYVGDDVSPDFYGWVFPKYDHVAVGTGTVVNKTAIKQYQQATRDRSKVLFLSLAVAMLDAESAYDAILFILIPYAQMNFPATVF